MRNAIGPSWILVLAGFALAACLPGQPAASLDGAGDGRQASGPKRMTLAIFGDPESLVHSIGGNQPGNDALERLVNAGLANQDERGVLQPQLAEAVPSPENGQWTLLPDGGMQTTWKIKPNLRWHDGQPFTSADVLFTARLGQDREIPDLYKPAYQRVASVEAPDPLTVVVRWSQPYVLADQLFTYSRSLQHMPLPRHLLEPTYAEDKNSLLTLSFWTEGFVGTGPYKVREFAAGSHLLLDAYDAYVLGRPGIDHIEVKIITDTNVALGAALAGAIDLTVGRGLSLDQANAVRQQGWNGKIELNTVNRYIAHPQLLNPNPPIITNVEFRRALLHAVDRQSLVDTLHFGLTEVSHTYVMPNSPAYPMIERAVVRYDYDPRRAAQMIERLGYTRGTDGVFRDGSGQRLQVEIRSTAEEDMHRKMNLAVGDFWQRIGVGYEPLFLTRAQSRDREMAATFPGFRIGTTPSQVDRIGQYMYGPQTPLPENGFVGGNTVRYMNPQYDALLDRFNTTIPVRERMAVLAEVVRHQTENLIELPLTTYADPLLVGPRVRNVLSPSEDNTTVAWSAHLWDVN